MTWKWRNDMERHPRWKGDAASDESARFRIRRRLKVSGLCAECDKPAMDRHHKDGNPRNNDIGNIVLLCRYHHMHAHGRTKVAREAKGVTR